MPERPDSEEIPPGLTPEAAFALLGEPTRFAIVRELWTAPTDVVSFSTLRDRVGARDTGRFNYHLKKLRGHFVRKVEDADGGAGGYELRQAGTEVVRAVLAGVINEAPVRDPAPIGAACPDCDGALLVGYDGHGTVVCGACDTVWMDNEFPPAGLAGRDAPELARALDRWTRHRSLLAFDGVCPACASETTLCVDVPFAERVCSHCGHRSRAPLWALVTDHPEVVSFLAERGIDAHAQAFWELATVGADTAESDDGFEVRFGGEAASLLVRLDRDLGVIRVERDD